MNSQDSAQRKDGCSGDDCAAPRPELGRRDFLKASLAILIGSEVHATVPAKPSIPRRTAMHSFGKEVEGPTDYLVGLGLEARPAPRLLLGTGELFCAQDERVLSFLEDALGLRHADAWRGQ